MSQCACLHLRSMSMRTLSMLGSRASTPRYGTLNSSRDFHIGLAAESRTLDRSHSNTFDRAQHVDHSRNGSRGFERSALMENSRPRNFERMLDGQEWTAPMTSPVPLQTFYAQQPPPMAVRNGGTRDHMHPPLKNSHISVGYVDMNHRGIVLFVCILCECADVSSGIGSPGLSGQNP